MNENITDNKDQNRFELSEGGHTAFATYKKEGATLFIKYVEAPPALRGTGTAGRLMGGIIRLARGESLKITPICGYAVSWLRKHKEHHDLIA